MRGPLTLVTGSLTLVTGSLTLVTGSLTLVTGSLTLVTGSLTRWAFGRQGTGCTHVPSSRLPVAHTAPPLGTNPPELEGRVRASA
jgi:hypothetical protein